MATLPTLITRALDLAPQLESLWGIVPELAIRVALAQEIVDDLGLHSPAIFSGLRSPEAQLRLIKEWEAGRLKNRPARQSWHTLGRAVDVGPEGMTQKDLVGFELFGFLMVQFGCRWGDGFDPPDRPHFDLPGPELPESVLRV